MPFLPSTTRNSGVPLVKLCGFATGPSAREAVAAGADAIGINFWRGSKRFIALDEAASWLGTLAGQVCRVGLFVNPVLEEIEAAVDRGVLDALQLHGITDPGFIAEAVMFGLPVIQAIGVGEQGPLADPAEFGTPWILLDAHVPGAFGGTGKTFSWDQFHEVAQAHPSQHFFLAGGLTSENVAEAIRIAQPYAVDAASGVESAPGIKDPVRMRHFVEAVRGARARG